MYSYKAFGLTITSELEIPELVSGGSDGLPDVSIGLGLVPEFPFDAKEGGVLFQAMPGRFRLALYHTRYLVEGGASMTVECLAPRPEQRGVLLMGACMGALLHQRGLLPLHGSAIATSRGAVVFLGPSGAGKSTLLGALLQRGYALLSDDIAAVRVDDQGMALVEPAIPRVRLWSDSAELLGHLPESLPREQPELAKFVVRSPAFAASALPILRIYVLGVNPLAPGIRQWRLTPIEAFKALTTHTYRRKFMKGLGVEGRHLELVSRVLSQAKVTALTRPVRPFLLQELADVLEEDFLA